MKHFLPKITITQPPLLATLWKSREIVEKAKFFSLCIVIVSHWQRIYRFYIISTHKQKVMPEEPKKALLIFAKHPLPGMVKTRLVPPLSPEEAADLYRCMLGDVMEMVTNFSDLALYLFYEGMDGARDYFAGFAPGITSHPQRGNDLGERMAEAFRFVFAMGHGAAVIIGTDAPDLPPAFIKEAFGRLESGKSKAVFGPCEDGGYYLLGLVQHNRALFRDLPWSSSAVLQESLKRAKEEGIEVSLLPMWHDVDTVADLERPELLAEENGAPRTRKFIGNWHRNHSNLD